MNNNEKINLDRAVISVSGADAHKFLQGLVSNDIGRATAKDAIYTYFLTPQGKYIFDLFISRQGEDFIIDIAEQDKELFLKKLKMYKLRSQVNIEELASKAVFAIKGSEGYSDPRNKNLPNRLIAEKNSAIDVSAIDEYHKLRVENNVPEGIYDLEKEKSFPLQYRMIELNGVDFKKGCYVGQEVTARTHHRGEVRKTTYTISSSAPLLKGDEILENSVPVGRVLTSTGNSALAIIESEKVKNSSAGLFVGINKIAISL
jgi:folate-binding protein YgfZ